MTWDERLDDALWQMVEATSLLREAHAYGALPPSLDDEIGEALPTIQAALKAFAALQSEVKNGSSTSRRSQQTASDPGRTE